MNDDWLNTDKLFEWDTPRARNTDRSTSHEAAASVRNVTKTQEAIIDCFAGPSSGSPRRRFMTDVDLAVIYQGRVNSGSHPNYPRVSDSGLRTRRKELEDRGYIVDTREKSRLPSGRRATVFTLSEQGIAFARENRR